MAVLSDAERALAMWKVIEKWKGDASSPPINKPQLREVVDAIDAWIEANQASFNTAIPQPQRGLLSQRLKALIFEIVATQRLGVL